MKKWTPVIPLLLLAACSKPNSPAAVAQNQPAQSGPAAPAAAPAPSAIPPPGANPEPVAPAPVEPAAPPPTAPALVIPAGTPLSVRLDAGVDTRRNRPGDPFTATLSRPVLVHGQVVLREGTQVRGHVAEAAASGRLKGRAVLDLTLDSARVHGREYPLRTSHVQRVGAAHKKRDAVLIGGGAGFGAALGAIAGGGKGAAIGALAGGGAGTAGAAVTGKEEIAIPAESVLVFTTRGPLRI